MGVGVAELTARLREELRHLRSRRGAPPRGIHQPRAGLTEQRACLRLVALVDEQLGHLAPVNDRLPGARSEAQGRPRLPARRLEHPPCLLPMMRQQRRPLLDGMAGEGLERARNRRVQRAPALAQERGVGHLAGQRMLEGVLALRIERGLVEKFALH